VRADSTEYLHVTLTTPDDITNNTVQLSFDNGTTWHTAEHVAGGVRLLVGPAGGAVTLTPGLRAVVVKVTDAPEVPIFTAGNLYVV